MAGVPFAVKLIGVRDLTRRLAKMDPLLRKDIGKKNKAIGQRVIDKASPKPIESGKGGGSVPRASANANVLQIRAGGSWRTGHQSQWGPRWLPRDTPRPYIAQAGEDDMPEIERDYLEALAEAARAAGLRFVIK